MKTRHFLHSLPELLRQQLPPELQDFQVSGPTMNLVKFHYGQRAIHYEVWVQRRAGQVEVGLHFEADDDTNRRYLELIRRHLEHLRAELGPQVEAEQWTPSWTRVHQTLPMDRLTDDLLFEVSIRLAQMIRTLEPLVRSYVAADSP